MCAWATSWISMTKLALAEHMKATAGDKNDNIDASYLTEMK